MKPQLFLVNVDPLILETVSVSVRNAVAPHPLHLTWPESMEIKIEKSREAFPKTLVIIDGKCPRINQNAGARQAFSDFLTTRTFKNSRVIVFEDLLHSFEAGASGKSPLILELERSLGRAPLLLDRNCVSNPAECREQMQRAWRQLVAGHVSRGEAFFQRLVDISDASK